MRYFIYGFSNYGSLISRSLMLTIIAMLSACATFLPSKPVIPIADGMYIYRATSDKAQSQAPTVLLVTGCGGMKANSPDDFHVRIAKQLNDNGFNAVILDYVKLMGQENACLGQIKFESVVSLVVEALDYAAQQPFVDPQRISLLGWSLGGSAVLTVAADISEHEQHRIKAVAAYYPGCYSGLHFSSFPTLLLLGMADNVVNPNDCLALAQKYPQAPLIIKTYPGAQHGFDVAEFKQAQNTRFLLKKFTLEYQEQASQDALQTLLDFLKETAR